MSTETKKAGIHTYCKFCKALGIKRVATHMSKYAPRYGMRDHRKHYSCIEHVELIEDTDPDRTRKGTNQKLKEARRQEDTHLTEADYQTWMKL